MAKTPKQIINQYKVELKDLMVENLETIASLLIKDIMKNYRGLAPSRKLDAIKNINLKMVQQYKSQLIEGVAIIARDAIDGAKKEVPARIKFGEYEKLPPKVRKRIEARANLIVGTQMADLEKNVFFEYVNVSTKTDSEKEIEHELVRSADGFIQGPSLFSGSQLFTSETVNEARQAYFYESEVIEQIQAFRFDNILPAKAQICKELVGRIFDVNDPTVDMYQPPLHFNCDSYWTPILKTVKMTRPIEKFTPTKKAQESIQFGEFCDCCRLQE